jgi:hypothetical protein
MFKLRAECDGTEKEVNTASRTFTACARQLNHAFCWYPDGKPRDWAWQVMNYCGGQFAES